MFRPSFKVFLKSCSRWQQFTVIQTLAAQFPQLHFSLLRLPTTNKGDTCLLVQLAAKATMLLNTNMTILKPFNKINVFLEHY